jgi:type II secretory pathway predicted ATPase ExeA
MTFISSIYTDHFGLSCKPFSLLPDPNFIFWSKGHKRAYSMLEYGLQNFAPIILITGEVGAGKTTLIHHLLRSASHDLVIGLISNAHGRSGRLLHWALSSLGQPVGGRATYVRTFRLFEDFLRAQASVGRHTVLIIDEAQNLSEAMIEELRCFSNLNGAQSELLQIILIGQPELRHTIAQPRLLQFSQRVASDFHLRGMSREGVHAYIAHRLKVAGAAHEIFTPKACDVIFEASDGLPRVVNQLCDTALVYAFADDFAIVDAELANQVRTAREARWQCGRTAGGSTTLRAN